MFPNASPGCDVTNKQRHGSVPRNVHQWLHRRATGMCDLSTRRYIDMDSFSTSNNFKRTNSVICRLFCRHILLPNLRKFLWGHMKGKGRGVKNRLNQDMMGNARLPFKTHQSTWEFPSRGVRVRVRDALYHTSGYKSPGSAARRSGRRG